jgi:S-methylmethionine-dependent homocysteine/selenocysteine methylase
VEEGKALLRKSVKIACEERHNFWVEYQQKMHAGTTEPGQYQRALLAASIGSYGAYLADGSEYRCVSFAPELDAMLIFFFMDVLLEGSVRLLVDFVPSLTLYHR